MILSADLARARLWLMTTAILSLAISRKAAKISCSDLASRAAVGSSRIKGGTHPAMESEIASAGTKKPVIRSPMIRASRCILGMLCSANCRALGIFKQGDIFEVGHLLVDE